MLIRIGFDIELLVSPPTTLVALLRVHPSREHDLTSSDAITVSPAMQLDQYFDSFGNRCSRANIPYGVQSVRLTSSATIRDSGAPDLVVPDASEHSLHELPSETLQFLLPSRYCDVDSDLLPFAWSQFGGVRPGWSRVQAICDYVHNHLRFDYQQARSTRTATEGWREQVGVCRDFTHLAVTLCRCMNIPARYCTGYLGDIGIPPVPYPMDFSAWFEVYLGGNWYTFDARHNTPRIGRVVIARGRDASDVPITMMFGPNTLTRFDVHTYEVV
jgi:transglutaminase-like putative cysteine protease